VKYDRFYSHDPARDADRISALRRASNGPVGADRWYTIRNASESEAEVLIYGAIGFDGISADDFVREFSAIRSNAITVRINSPGGSVYDAIPIYNAIRRHKAQVTAYIDGIGASAASFIFQAADKRVMSPHSELFIHDAAGLVLGNAEDMRRMADDLDKISDNIASIYAERSGTDIAQWRDLMRAETTFSDSEAVEAGLADEIDGREVVALKPGEPTNEVSSPAAPSPEAAPTPEAESEPMTAPIDWIAEFNKVVEEAEEAEFSAFFASEKEPIDG
jgi:ATP-dependent Clp endopeptidase proteolytic subunit ClpP